VIHPPDKKERRAFKEGDEIRKEKTYLQRNKDIVDETTLLVATPKGDEVRRSGTWMTIRYFRKVKGTVPKIIYP
jgi:hypothetical protein